MKGYGIISTGKHGWIEKEKPVAGPLDAILRPLAVAPCSSDTHAMHGGGGDKKNIIMGHESVGEVVEVGSLVKDFKPGDVVVVPCCTPDYSAVGIQQRDANMAHDRRLIGGFKFLSQKDGVFAEFYHVNHADGNLVKLPEDVKIDAALMTTDMMSTGFYGVEMADVQFGDTVVIFGIGPVGLMAVAAAKLRGAGRIIVTGTRPNCVELAREFGATDVINYKQGDVVQQILELSGKVDRCIIAGGNTGTLTQALQVARPNSVIANVNYFDSSESFNYPAMLWGLGMADITIRGGFCPGGAYRIHKMLELIRYGRVEPEKLLNVKFEGFDKIPDAFVMMDEKPRELIKPVVHIQW